MKLKKSPNRQIHAMRHEMLVFVSSVQNYVKNQALDHCWAEFEAELAEIGDIDAIFEAHSKFVNKVIFRYFQN